MNEMMMNLPADKVLHQPKLKAKSVMKMIQEKNTGNIEDREKASAVVNVLDYESMSKKFMDNPFVNRKKE